MARSIWNGAISFGLVNVPVKLYSAVSKQTVRFHQLHEEDGVRIQQKRICPADGKEVPYQNIVKGYEIEPERYVVIKPEELAALESKRGRTIDIEDFVELDQIDPIYYDHPYYLVPDKSGAKAYKMLLEAMEQSGKVAIARVVIRSKENLTAIRAADGILMMSTMLFADEVVSPSVLEGLPDDDVRPTERELEMARELIESVATEFDPNKYQDTYREQVMALIESKAAGDEVATQPETKEAKPVADLLGALEASIAAAKKGASNSKKAKKPARQKSSASKAKAKT